MSQPNFSVEVGSQESNEVTISSQVEEFRKKLLPKTSRRVYQKYVSWLKKNFLNQNLNI